jgi:hypothetical protein
MIASLLIDFGGSIYSDSLIDKAIFGALIASVILLIIAAVQILRHRNRTGHGVYWLVFMITIIALTYNVEQIFTHFLLQNYHNEMSAYAYQNTNMATTVIYQHNTQWKIARVSLVFEVCTFFEGILFLIAWLVCRLPQTSKTLTT